MKIVHLGDESDARGFSLAGVEARRVADGHELARRLRELGNDRDVGLVLVSRTLAAQAPDAVRAAAALGVPLLLTLPVDEDA